MTTSALEYSKNTSYLIDIGHPAHVHLFKNFIRHLESREIDHIVTSREKDVTKSLLDHYGIGHIQTSKQASSLTGMIKELFQRTKFIFTLHNERQFTHAIGTSVSIGFLTLRSLGEVRSVSFCEDDDNVIMLQAMLAYPFASEIVNPDCLRFHFWKRKRTLVPSYHELAYLHPNNFEPDPNVLKQYKLTPKSYIVLRLSSLKAHHDITHEGINAEILALIETSIDGYIILRTSEGAPSTRIEPWDMHHILYYSKLLISDSQTMTAEAAVLGTPSVRINTFKGRISYLRELEEKFELTHSFLPAEKDKALEMIKYLLTTRNVDETYQKRRRYMLSQKIDFNEWMLDNL